MRLMTWLMPLLYCSAVMAGVDDRVVVLLGDSTTLSRESSVDEKYADFVQGILVAQPDGGDIRVINSGKGGDTANGALGRVDSDVAAWDPDVVVVSFGLNDLGRRTPDEFESDLRRLVQAIRARTRAEVILTTSTPFDDRHVYARKEPFLTPGSLDQHFDTQINERTRKLASQLGLLLCDPHRAFEQVIGAPDGGSSALLHSDGVHLTLAGNRLMAETVVPAIVQSLGRRDPLAFPGVLPSPKEYHEDGEPAILAEIGQSVRVQLFGSHPALATAREGLAQRLHSLGGTLVVDEKSPLVRIGTVADWPADVSLPTVPVPEYSESYTLTVEADHNSRQAAVTIVGADAMGAFYGVQTLIQLLARGAEGITARQAVIRDWPTFSFRLFKGQCWYFRDNHTFIEWMDRYKWNVFGSCYTDCKEWREPPDAYRQMIGQLCETARKRDTVRVLQLGNPYVEKAKAIQASADGDVEKLASFFELSLSRGSDVLMLCLDDFAFLSEDDAKKFGSLAGANVSIVNRFAERIHARHPRARILLCPPPYWLTAHQAKGYEWAHQYLREFCAGIPGDIAIVWTGRHVTTVRQEEPDIRAYQELVGGDRALFLWDNTLKMPPGWSNTFRINPFLAACDDIAGSAWPTLADFTHGEAGINTYGPGEVYKIPLMTAADYLWNPQAYDPHESLRRALYWFDENPRVGPLLYRFTNGLHQQLFNKRITFLAGPSRELLGELGTLVDDYRHLFERIATETRNVALVDTLRPYLRRHVEVMPIFADILAASNGPTSRMADGAAALSRAEQAFAVLMRSLLIEEPASEVFGLRRLDLENENLKQIQALTKGPNTKPSAP